MEESFNFSRTTLRNIQRIIDNLYLVKILKTQENELKISIIIYQIFIEQKEKVYLFRCKRHSS